MVDLQLLHNPRCSKSRAALDAIWSAGQDVQVVSYLTEPLDEAQLRELLGKLDDPPAALVRRDALYAELGLSEADIADADRVAALLAAHPRLMERPVLVRGDRAVIGRPTERVVAFLQD